VKPNNGATAPASTVVSPSDEPAPLLHLYCVAWSTIANGPAESDPHLSGIIPLITINEASAKKMARDIVWSMYPDTGHRFGVVCGVIHVPDDLVINLGQYLKANQP
jgi:hypothetical protein